MRLLGRDNSITIPSIYGLDLGWEIGWDSKDLELPMKICDSRRIYLLQRFCASSHNDENQENRIQSEDQQLCFIMYHRVHNVEIAEIIMIYEGSGYSNYLVYGTSMEKLNDL